MADKKYRFYLEPFVYVSVKGRDLLLYNLADGRFLTYYHQPHLVDFILRLKQEKNLYALEVSDHDLRENGLEDFVRDIREHFMGDLADVSLTGRKKPFLLSPLFDVQESVQGGVQQSVQEKGKTRARRTFTNVSKDSFLALKELTFYIEGSCAGDCAECGTAYKQFPWCTREENNGRMDLADIEKILDDTRGCFLETINIIGGDIGRYPQLTELTGLLNSRALQVNYYLHVLHLQNNTLDTLLGQIGPAATATSTVYLFINCSQLKNRDRQKYLETLPRERVNIVFLIQHEHEFAVLEKVIDKLQLTAFSVQPYFNGKNLDFFKDNVFTDHESLSGGDLDVDAIKARQSYNTLNYGKLFFKNGRVYSNLNAAPLGRLDELSPREAVVRELKEQGNWLRVRRDAAPCKDCLLDAVCPPLSNFEFASGINDSCNIWRGAE
jgi:pseudo-rSAM protein